MKVLCSCLVVCSWKHQFTLKLMWTKQVYFTLVKCNNCDWCMHEAVKACCYDLIDILVEFQILNAFPSILQVCPVWETCVWKLREITRDIIDSGIVSGVSPLIPALLGQEFPVWCVYSNELVWRPRKWTISIGLLALSVNYQSLVMSFRKKDCPTLWRIFRTPHK